MATSVRSRLLVGAATAITLLFAVLGGILYFCVRTWLIAEFDRGLLGLADSLRAATEYHHQQIRIDFDGEQPAEFLGGPHSTGYELWQSQTPLTRSASLGAKDLPFVAVAPGRPQYRFTSLPDQRPGRLIAMTFALRQSNEEGDEPSRAGSPPAELTLIVARDTSHLAAALAQLRWLLIAACGAALLIGLGLLGWIIRRGLRPVDAIAARISRVGRASLSDRLETAGVPGELLPVVDRINQMLSRLETAFARERAFTADVAHELRTPLAGLQTSLEVCSSLPREPREYQRVLGQCHRVTRQMQAMVDSLLVLARADAGNLLVQRTAFPLTTLIDEAWQPFTGRAEERGLKVDRADDFDARIYTDRDKLRQALSNLFDNAVSYADEGGSVTISCDRGEAGSIAIRVSNTGSKLSQEQANRACDRFWRGDAARTDTGTHCGLGLAITRELIAVLSGTLRVESTRDGRFIVDLILPNEPNGHAPANQVATASV
jgi:two-component system heavy metal sensor histidine kinase CusS